MSQLIGMRFQKDLKALERKPIQLSDQDDPALLCPNFQHGLYKNAG